MRPFSIPLLVLALAGCPAGDPDIDPPGELLSADIDRDRDPDVTPAQLAQLTADNRGFAFDLYHQLAEGNDDNLFLSPHSVSIALAMTWAGAEGNTETQLAEAMHFTLPEPGLHEAFNALDLDLATRVDLPKDVKGTAPELHIVNQTFGQTGYPFEAAFLEVLARHYGAGMALLDFALGPDAARALINQWVEDMTRDRILDLLPAGSISSDTKLVLVNAIYFKASWAEPFEVANTANDPFVLLDGTQVDVPTMHGSVEGTYAHGDGWELVELPYVGDKLAMSVIVPEAGRFAEIEAGLDVAFFDAATDSASEYAIDLDLPKFSFRSAANLVPAMKALGATDPFLAGVADFSGMSTASDLYISGIYHQAFVDLNEEGTEAAAATAVVMEDTSAPDYVEVDIDRPFLIALRDRPTGEILFLGRVTDPRN